MVGSGTLSVSNHGRYMYVNWVYIVKVIIRLPVNGKVDFFQECVVSRGQLTHAHYIFLGGWWIVGRKADDREGEKDRRAEDRADKISWGDGPLGTLHRTQLFAPWGIAHGYIPPHSQRQCEPYSYCMTYLYTHRETKTITLFTLIKSIHIIVYITPEQPGTLWVSIENYYYYYSARKFNLTESCYYNCV